MKQRLLSALVMIIILVPVYLIGGKLFLIFNGILAIIAYKEMSDLNKKTPFIATILGLLSLLLVVYANVTNFNIPYYALIFPFIILLIPLLFKKDYKVNDAFNLIFMVLFLGISFNAFNLFVINNKAILLYLVIITCVNDVFAYLVGSLIGKHHFTKISPKKTIEGCFAGLIFGSVAGILFYLNFIDSFVNINYIIILTIILNIASICGDLIFSKIKRDNNIKDFSNLIPGHGGLLDRLDSLIFTSLVYLFITTII